MSVTHYVALLFVRTEDGVAPGAASRECRESLPMPARSRSSEAAIRTWAASTMPRF